MEGKKCVDLVFAFKQVVGKVLEKKETVYAALKALENSYDKVKALGSSDYIVDMEYFSVQSRAFMIEVVHV